MIVKLDGWITDSGELNMARLQVLMKEIAVFDRQHFSDGYSDLQYMGGT